MYSKLKNLNNNIFDFIGIFAISIFLFLPTNDELYLIDIDLVKILVLLIFFLLRIIFDRNFYFISGLFELKEYYLLIVFLVFTIFSISSFFFDSSLFLKESARILIYLIIIYLYKNLRISITYSLFFILAISILNILIQVLTYLNYQEIKNFILDFYVGNNPDALIQFGNTWGNDLSSFRSGSVLINPNIMASFYLFSLAYLVSIIKVIPYKILIYFLFLVGIVLTGSRTGFALFGLIFLIDFIYFFFETRKSNVLFLLSPLFIFAVVLIVFNFDTFYFGRAGDIISGFGNSFSVKAQNFLLYLENYTSPLFLLFGSSPGIRIQVDADIYYVFMWYGLGGFIIFFTFILYLSRNLSKFYSSKFAILFLFIVILSGLTMGIFLNLIIFSFVLFLYSILQNNYNKNVKISI